MDLHLIPAKQNLLDSIIKLNVERGKSRICEQGDISKGLIQSPTERRQDEYLLRIHRNSPLDGELQIGLILVMREQLQRDVTLFEPLYLVFPGGIQIADDEVWFKVERAGMACAPIRTDDVIICADEGTGFVPVR